MADLSESMECLCYLMKTIGPKLDSPKAKVCFYHFLIETSLKSFATFVFLTC